MQWQPCCYIVPMWLRKLLQWLCYSSYSGCCVCSFNTCSNLIITLCLTKPHMRHIHRWLSVKYPFQVLFTLILSLLFPLCVAHCAAFSLSCHQSQSLLFSQNIDEHYQSAAIADKHKLHRENCSENGFLNSSVLSEQSS